MSKILAFAGSTRRESFNRKLIALAVQQARDAGTEVTLVELSDYPMPLYDADLQEAKGCPEACKKLHGLMLDHQGLLLACPEYNSSITPLLKNTIDWVSRSQEGEPQLAAFTGKVAGLLSASPGKLGGLRGLVTVRSILGNIGVHVIPKQAAVPNAHDAFDEAGKLRDSSTSELVEAVVTQLAETTKQVAAK